MNLIKPATVLCLLVCGSVAVFAQKQNFPALTIQHTNSIRSILGSDSPASTFVDSTGSFRYITTLAQYDNTDNGDSFIKTYINSDIGIMNYAASSDSVTTYDTFYNRPASYCYQIDKRETDPIDSPREDDHCDAIGVWVDPSSGNWYGIVHDEFNFNPWSATDGGDVYTGIHFDRLMYAISSDQGVTWQLKDPIITSPFGDQADANVFPGVSWYYGDGDPRLFVDNSTGYFYVYYSSHILTKGYGTRLTTWNCVARAPISGKMATGTWNKWYNGEWTEPGLGGKDGIMGTNLTATYTPASDSVSYTGTGPDGNPLTLVSALIPTSGKIPFTDPATDIAYSIDLSASTRAITNTSSGTQVAVVSYSDPSIGDKVTVSVVDNSPQIVFTDLYTGVSTTTTVSTSLSTDFMLYYNQATKGLANTTFLGGVGAITTYNAYLGKYMLDGEGYVYQNDDLGNQNNWSVIGSSAGTGYYPWDTDSGSLTNSRATGSSFRRYDLSTYKIWDISMTAPSAGEKYYGTQNLPVDSLFHPISSNTNYLIGEIYHTASGVPIPYVLSAGATGSRTLQWKLIPVSDQFDASKNSGFYRIQSVEDGTVLLTTGSVIEQRAVGAQVLLGNQVAGADPAALGYNGTPGGSDQWYLEPIAHDVPATLSSTEKNPQFATATSLRNISAYKIVNRNSGLVLQIENGTPVLRPDHHEHDYSSTDPNIQQDQSVLIVPVGANSTAVPPTASSALGMASSAINMQQSRAAVVSRQ